MCWYLAVLLVASATAIPASYASLQTQLSNDRLQDPSGPRRDVTEYLPQSGMRRPESQLASHAKLLEQASHLQQHQHHNVQEHQHQQQSIQEEQAHQVVQRQTNQQRMQHVQREGGQLRIPVPCNSVIGVGENGSRPPESFTDSSELNKAHGAQFGRLGSESAWCADWPLMEKTGQDEWIEVDLGMDYFVTGVQIQGLVGAQVRQYELAYSSDAHAVTPLWPRKFTFFPDKLLGTNANLLPLQEHELTPPFTARWVRLYPRQWQGLMCLRFALRGCVGADLLPS